MGCDLITLFDSSLVPASPEWMLARVRPESPALAAVIERYRDRWRVKEWTSEASRADGLPSLVGPGGFSFSFRTGVVEMYHATRFSVFAHDPEVRLPLRRVTREIANILGTGVVIYTHELMPYAGDSFHAMESSLRVEFGPPAGGFEELASAEQFGPGAWYIDDFSDLAIQSGRE